MKKLAIIRRVCLGALLGILFLHTPTVRADDAADQQFQAQQQQAAAQQAQEEEQRRLAEDQQRRDQEAAAQQQAAFLQQQQEEVQRQQQAAAEQQAEGQRQAEEQVRQAQAIQEQQQQQEQEQEAQQARQQQDDFLRQQQEQQLQQSQEQQRQEDEQRQAEIQRQQAEQEEQQRLLLQTQPVSPPEDEPPPAPNELPSRPGLIAPVTQSPPSEASPVSRERHPVVGLPQARLPQTSEHPLAPDRRQSARPWAGMNTPPQQSPPNGRQAPVEGRTHAQTTVARPALAGNTLSARTLIFGWTLVGCLVSLAVLIVLLSLAPPMGNEFDDRRVEAMAVPSGVTRLPMSCGTPPVCVHEHCRSCGKSVRVLGGGPGKKFRCPRCGTLQRIEAEEKGRVRSATATRRGRSGR